MCLRLQGVAPNQMQRIERWQLHAMPLFFGQARLRIADDGVANIACQWFARNWAGCAKAPPPWRGLTASSLKVRQLTFANTNRESMALAKMLNSIIGQILHLNFPNFREIGDP
jgi:hypothetical protein